jgi:hypothetical protein
MTDETEPPAEMTFEDMQLMVCEGINDIDADHLVKVFRAMFDAKIKWSNAKDCYLVRISHD